PTPKMTTATIRLQKYSSLPWPNGCSRLASTRLRRMPNSMSTLFEASTTECTPSEIIAELPVNAAATNFATAIRVFPAKAATNGAVEWCPAATATSTLRESPDEVRRAEHEGHAREDGRRTHAPGPERPAHGRERVALARLFVEGAVGPVV